VAWRDLRAHGGYRHLRSYQVARLLHDVTVRFCDRFLPVIGRTREQMIQAARSGVQNIVEGSLLSLTSPAGEMRLTNIARASIGELRQDYEDFLRQRALGQWATFDPRLASLIGSRPSTVHDFATWVEATRCGDGPSVENSPTGDHAATKLAADHRPCRSAEIAANGALALATVASSLLHRQLAAQLNALSCPPSMAKRMTRPNI